MTRAPTWLNVQRGPLAFGVLLALFAVAVLLPGFRLAGRLDDTAAALRLVSEQRRQPDVLAGSLTSVRDRLESYGYVDEPLAEIRKGVNDLDSLVARLERPDATLGTFDASPARAVRASPEISAELARLEQAWAEYRKGLEPIAAFKGVPYSDSESAGTQLNAAGRKLAQQVTKAIASSRKQTPALIAATGRISAALEAESTRLSSYLRLLMLAALAVTLALGAALAYFVIARRREAGLLADAQRQTQDILRTVKDGLFLLDAQHRIGAAHSASLAKLFKREQLSGLTFDELLKPLVPERTLATATKFVDVLWSERTKENLVKSINPLQEVEVSFDGGNGGLETRWLEFDFHRVRNSAGKIQSLLVSVNDVTARVQLARELAESREKAQSQLDTLLGVLHLDPQQLRSFLDDSDAAMKMVNAILREPAREESAFRRKLDSIFRQIHAMKGEAAALGLGTVESRAHEFEDALKELRERPALSGGDFLPLVVKLDDLFTHLSAIRDLLARLAHLNFAAEPAAPRPAPAPAGPRELDEPPAPVAKAAEPPSDTLTHTLAQLVERVAGDCSKQARLAADGLATVPPDYRRAVKDIAVQIVRNAIVHGIEDPELRERGGKPTAGTVKVEFRAEGAQGYRLVIEDDGAGLSPRRIRETAVRRGLVTPDEAARLDSKQLMALLFRPGFSTQEVADEHAGRGVGMSVVAELVKEMKGRIAVATGEGRYTRFTIVLPPDAAAAAA